MLLDKGENILYLSHKIPELNELVQVFVEIWQSIHAPDVMAKMVAGHLGNSEESQKALEMVVNHIRRRMKNGDIMPVCIRDFVDRQLRVWTKSAFRAKYLVTTDDSYKLDDLRDGKGQQLVIMDKETGVEQVSMHWSQGLHQFLQLKHSLKLSPVSLKAVFMSNMSYFNEFNGRLFGLTGTLGSEAECSLLNEIFGVQFLKMPRFRRRFCSQLNALLTTNEHQWLINVSRETRLQSAAADEKKRRAVLIVCENISAVNLIVKQLEDDLKGNELAPCKIRLRAYTSSFDTQFQKEQQEKSLEPGDVIVATNLAGRGTDLKISPTLEKNGGLHVIISYVPANARVEAQAQGRTARAGQPGTYQFVVCCSQLDESFEEEDHYSELLQLNEKRDESEAIRLEQLGTRGLDKIKTEEELLKRFREEIYKPVGQTCSKLQLSFLTNKWALWLDENSGAIQDPRSKEGESLSSHFDQFKESCLRPTAGVIRFTSTPSELIELGRHLKNGQCFLRAIEQEPNHCEGALIQEAHRILQKQKKFSEKLKAKRLMQHKIEILSSSGEILKLTAKLSRRESDTVNTLANSEEKHQSRFDEQVTI